MATIEPELKPGGFVMPKKLGTNFILPKFSPSSTNFNYITGVVHNITLHPVFLNLINQGGIA